ncbi:glycosyltransferase family 2 protein [Aequorivita capsosiphonis]|uniref:glycosyltransferase family 2 protein n=1 Tax=Aequorivita capsosiphonis TaxID=487317 RepID=UPI0004160767|nr:glycosyltransferase family 2 protein [Aequorivita capsosiphonis]
MKVSIITPVYNASRFLKLTANSVINQVYEDWEWVLVDDCSKDDSWQIMQELAARDSRIRIFRNPSNLKSGKTRNFAIQKAEGRYIAFLDSDDLWHKDKLAIQIPFMLENNYHFSHTSYGYLSEEGSAIKSTLHVKDVVDYKGLLKRTEISCLTAVYDAEKIGKFYMSEHARKQDYALWLAILKSGVKSYGIDKELAYYRQVNNSATSKKYKLILKHITFLKDTQGFSSIKSLYYTCHWMLNGVVRYYIK